MADTPPAESSAARRFQTRVAVLLLLVCAATVGAVDALATNRWLAARMAQWELAQFREGRDLFRHRGQFIEFEDRLLIEEIPTTDHAAGGVYFLGSSNMKWGLKLWSEPHDVQERVHNYGIGSTNHELRYQFARFLVEHHAFLSAAPGSDLVVLGVSFTSLVDRPAGDYFHRLWPRHGLYTYDSIDGIHPAPILPLQRAYRARRARWLGFLTGSAKTLLRYALVTTGVPLSWAAGVGDDRARIRAWADTYTGPVWTDRMDRQLRLLREHIDYLRESGSMVAVVLLPIRPDILELPIPARYASEVSRVCRDAGVPLHDLSALLADDEFLDISHANHAGLEKVHTRLMHLALAHLQGVAQAPDVSP